MGYDRVQSTTKWACISPSGSFIKRRMLKYFQARDTVYVSRSPGELIPTARGLVQTIAHEEMLMSDCTHVYIGTPTDTHERLVLDCIKAGKHVLVEKTPATCSLRFQEVQRLANKYGCKLEVACQCYELFRHCQKQVSAGVDRIEVSMNLPLEGRHKNPVWDVAWYGLVLGQTCSRGRACDWKEFTRIEKLYRVHLKYPNFVLHFEFSIDAKFKQELSTLGFPGNEVREKPFTGRHSMLDYGASIDRFERGEVVVLPHVESALPLFDWVQSRYDNAIS
jgi:hypothetical protein